MIGVRSTAQRRKSAPAPARPEAQVESLASILRERLLRLLGEERETPVEGLHPALLRELERSLLSTVLEFTGGHRERAATILGLHRNSLRRRLRATGLEAAPVRRRPRRARS